MVINIAGRPFGLVGGILRLARCGGGCADRGGAGQNGAGVPKKEEPPEKLLSIGEDPQDINRKNKPYWGGILRTRVMILSNQLPNFKDDTGVIGTRSVIVQTRVSFLGREDTQLEARLAVELSGILNWALDGWDRLAERAKFEVLGAELNESAGMASPVKAFVDECCEVGNPEWFVTIDTLYASYREWCIDWNYECVVKNQFGVQLRVAFHDIKVELPRAGNPGRQRRCIGWSARVRTDL
jgi:putative DNA primase/helicase